MRQADIERNTTETKIKLSLRIDGKGKADVETGVGFLDHMLTAFCRHAGMDLHVRCKGDLAVDSHHTVEDVGIVLGQALSRSLFDCRGIRRFGFGIYPMDEALLLVSLDISGRGGYYGEVSFPAEKIGDLDTELIEEFFVAFCRTSGVTLHFQKLAGKNAHHIAEAMFKGFARALKDAASVNPDAADEVPSSKGMLV